MLTRKVLGKIFAILGLLTLISWMPGVTTMRAAANVVVDLGGERIKEASPAAADFNNNGYKEIVIGGPDGMLYVVAYNGSTWSKVWSRQVVLDLDAAGAPTGCATRDKSDIRSSPAIGDLDGDGRLEIVVAVGGDPGNHRHGGVLVYRYVGDSPWSFSLASGWPQPKLDKVGGGEGASLPDGCWDGFWGSPAIGDLDEDGDLEVVAMTTDRHIHAWHHDGKYVSGWPIYRYIDETDQVESTYCLLRGGWSSPALGDIDGDGLSEVVVGTDSPPWNCPGNWGSIDYRYATVWAINGDGSNVPGWPVTTTQNVFSSPALGDITGDGRLEVVVGTGSYSGYNNGDLVYAWRYDGSAVPGWPRPTAGKMPASPALGDLNGDGSLEVVIGCGASNNSTCKNLYAWHGNGDLVSGFPVSPTNTYLPHPPVLADYDGNGDVEILVVGQPAQRISVVHKDGTMGTHLEDLNQIIESSPLVDDVDGDGLLEVVIGGGNAGGAKLLIWDVSGGINAKRPWPMFHHNVHRTGAIPEISGRVVDVHNAPFAGVTVFADSGVSDVTDATGRYRLSNMAIGTHVVTPTLSGYAFVPVSRTVVVPPGVMNQNFVILASPVSVALTPGVANHLVYTDTQGLPTRLDFPADAVSVSTTLILTPTLAAAGSGFKFTGHAFELAAYQGGLLQPDFAFGNPVTVTIRYSDADVTSITSEEELVLAWWNGATWQDAAETCTPNSVYTHDPVNNRVSVSICHLTTFALFGPVKTVYLPIVLRNH